MTKGRVLEVNERKTSQGKPIFDVNVESEGKTVKYQCWDAIIKDKQGKEIEFTVKESANPAFPTPTLIMPKGDGSSAGKKPFTPYNKVADPANLAMMELSYKKDTMRMAVDVALAVSGRADHLMTELEIAKMAVDVYKKIGYPLFHKEKTVTAEQVANAVGGKVVPDSEVPW